MTKGIPRHCSFCGAEHTKESPLIAGKDGRICESCTRLAGQIVESWGRRSARDEMLSPPPVPMEMKDGLDTYVIGQGQAKEVLSVAVYNHFKRLASESQPRTSTLETEGPIEVAKSNILLLGPSGTGKTLLARTLAKIAGVPFVIADATSLTQAGYVGDDVDSIIERLLEAAGGNVGLAEWGIVYIDEIDKLAKRGGGMTGIRDISGEGVQQALLKIVEGSKVKVSSKGGRRSDKKDTSIDTRNILFIAGGAFDGLEEVVTERMQEGDSKIGFHAAISDSKPVPIKEENVKIKAGDLRSFGLIPEFIGRFPVIATLDPLNNETLVRILTEPKDALVRQYQELFRHEGVELVFTDAALKAVADTALASETGARGLRGVLEDVLQRTMFELPSKENIVRCEVDVEAITDGGGAGITLIEGEPGRLSEAPDADDTDTVSAAERANSASVAADLAEIDLTAEG